MMRCDICGKEIKDVIYHDERGCKNVCESCHKNEAWERVPVIEGSRAYMYKKGNSTVYKSGSFWRITKNGELLQVKFPSLADAKLASDMIE